jgi:ribose 1,5-bisphosphate isomerase
MFRLAYQTPEDFHEVATMETVHAVADKIRRLEVKGARNVAIAAVETMTDLALKTRAKNRKAFLLELAKARAMLFASRPTEPLMRNAINWIVRNIEKCERKKVAELARIVSSCSCEFLRSLEESRERIAEIGSNRIRDGKVVFTHCHSSTVTYMLRKARESGKKFEIICTETRPVFQGRITAKEMLSLGVKTTLIVDSAARSFMPDVDIVVVGADAITSEGNVVNKIGTATIATLAHEARVPLYVVSELLKFDPATLCGEYEVIEERNRDEVWKEAPEMLVVKNPAFDVTRRDFIRGIICEEGIIPPQAVYDVVQRRYPWVFERS